jgi:maleate isomerase
VTDDRVLLGVLTPSSNTRLEPLTSGLVQGLPEVSAHFSRFRVVEMSLSPTALGQFATEPVLAASELLADARVDVIVWSGTSGGWKGLDADRELCARITERTGVPATTATLALLEATRISSAQSVALVTPYPQDMQAAITATLGGAGLTVAASVARPETSSNWELSQVTPAAIAEMVAQAVAAEPDVIWVFCTNLAAADLVDGWEREHQVPVFDSVAASVWHALRLVGVDTARVQGWGSMFALSR